MIKVLSLAALILSTTAFASDGPTQLFTVTHPGGGFVNPKAPLVYRQTIVDSEGVVTSRVQTCPNSEFGVKKATAGCETVYYEIGQLETPQLVSQFEKWAATLTKAPLKDSSVHGACEDGQATIYAALGKKFAIRYCGVAFTNPGDATAVTVVKELAKFDDSKEKGDPSLAIFNLTEEESTPLIISLLLSGFPTQFKGDIQTVDVTGLRATVFSTDSTGNTPSPDTFSGRSTTDTNFEPTQTEQLGKTVSEVIGPHITKNQLATYSGGMGRFDTYYGNLTCQWKPTQKNAMEDATCTSTVFSFGIK